MTDKDKVFICRNSLLVPYAQNIKTKKSRPIKNEVNNRMRPIKHPAKRMIFSELTSVMYVKDHEAIYRAYFPNYFVCNLNNLNMRDHNV